MCDISGKCSLIIRGKDTLNFNEIEKVMGVTATEKCNKGYVFSRLAPNGAPSDVWIYSIEIGKDGDVNKALDKLLNKIKISKSFISNLSILSDICLRCYVQSNLAQIGFSISPYTVNELANINVRFELSILSWGQVIK